MRSAPLLALCVFFLASAGLRAGDWAVWRGAQGDGVSIQKGFPTRWSATENVRKPRVPLDMPRPSSLASGFSPRGLMRRRNRGCCCVSIGRPAPSSGGARCSSLRWNGCIPRIHGHPALRPAMVKRFTARFSTAASPWFRRTP
jgi:hypothetical protein